MDTRLPDILLRELDGRGIDRRPPLAMTLSVASGADGPLLCMLSAGEIVAVDDRSLYLALWKGTRTSRALDGGVGVLQVVTGGISFGIRLRGERVADLVVEGSALIAFRASITEVDEDRVEYARLDDGPTFVLPDDRVRARWRATIDALRGVSRR